MTKPILVLDTNIIVSALISQNNKTSPTVQILEQVLQGNFITAYSDLIIQEYTDVLLRNKFNFSADLVNILITEIKNLGELIEPKVSDIKMPDPDDVIFYDTFLTKFESESCYLITGNLKHFPEHPNIISPRDFLDCFNS